MKTKEKKQLIARAIEAFVKNGYCIETFIGKPISYFDEEKLKIIIKDLNLKNQIIISIAWWINQAIFFGVCGAK